DCRADARIGAAAAEVATHRLLDVLFSWTWRGFEECTCSHDLSALAVATLDHVLCNPCVLNYSSHRVAGHCFDRYDGTVADVRDRNDARTRRNAPDMYGAGAARADAATEFSSCKLEIFTQHPEQWR